LHFGQVRYGPPEEPDFRAFEDKIVQDALREVLQAVYEQDFLECSYGFRPRRRAHDAIRAFDRVASRGEVNWVLEADIKSFFDSVDRNTLLELLRIRVPDGSIKRLVGKCLHVGVLDGGDLTRPDTGTAQGSVLSPLLANVYLHYALDLWFEREVKPRLHGRSTLIRYADDFIICFELRSDAERVMDALSERLATFALTLEPTKTRLIPFHRPSPSEKRGKGPATFDFLGFTLFWRRTRRGGWCVGCKTRHARLRRAIARRVSAGPTSGGNAPGGRLRLVPQPSAFVDPGAACRAALRSRIPTMRLGRKPPSGIVLRSAPLERAHLLQTHSRPLQLLRGQWQPPESWPSLPSCSQSMVQVALSSEPEAASQLGTVRGLASRLSYSASSCLRQDMGDVTASRTDGRAGWWKSPRPDLVRAWAGQPAQATLPRRPWTISDTA